MRAGLFAGLAVGGVHGVLRAEGIIANLKLSAEPYNVAMRFLHWRTADGLAMLAVGGWLAHGL
jgi:hypothetical protein